jgi:uncharacterized protein (DUF58 family)
VSEPLWDAEVVARIRALQLTARGAVDGLLHGDHRSGRIGQAVEFAGYKEYAPGDELRHLDWRVLARTDTYVVRRYQVETEWPAVLVVDASADLSTGGEPPSPGPVRGLLRRVLGSEPKPPPRPVLHGSKFAMSVQLAASLAWYLIHNQEPVGLLIVGGETTRARWLPPRSGTQHLARIFGTLADLRPSGTADLGAALSTLGPRVRNRSLVVLISDFMEETPTWGPALSGLARRRCDVVGLHVLDRAEMELAFDRPLVFFSPEGGGDLPVDAPGAAEEYATVRDAWFREVHGALVEHGGRYLRAWTDASVVGPLGRLIAGHPGELPQ